MTITEVRGDNYRGIDRETEVLTRWMPASHLKLFSEISFIVTREKSKISGSTWSYHVEMIHGERIWVSEECVTPEVLREFKERLVLRKAK